jgi:hypothetical protein
MLQQSPGAWALLAQTTATAYQFRRCKGTFTVFADLPTGTFVYDPITNDSGPFC